MWTLTSNDLPSNRLMVCSVPKSFLRLPLGAEVLWENGSASYPAKETDMSEAPKVNIAAELVRIHRVITRGLKVAIEHSQSFAREGYPDATTQEGFIAYVRTLVSVTHGHHLTEDEVAFPHVRDKLPDAPWDSLMRQHREMESLLKRIEASIEEGALDELNRIVRELADIWGPHIEVEQTHESIEVAAKLWDEDEHVKMARMFAEHSQQHSGPDYLAVPFVLFNLSPEDRAAISAQMPPVVTQELVAVVCKDKWAPMKPFLLE